MTHRDLPVVAREIVEPLATPVIPLNFVYPGLSLAQIISILRAYRGPIVLIMLAALVATVLLMALLPKTYTASASLMVNYEVNDPSNGKEIPLGLLGGYISTQVELMQNPEVLLTVVDRLKLTKHKDYIEGYRAGNGSLREWAAKQVSKNLVIYQGQFGSQIIYVGFSAHNATEAALVANTIVDTYLAMSQARSLKAQVAGRVRSLEGQLAAEEAQLARHKITLADFHPQVLELQSQILASRQGLAAAMNGDLSVPVAAANPLRLPQEAAKVDNAGQTVQTPALERAATEIATTTSAASRSQHANVSVVSRAIPPAKSVKPKMLTGLILGAMIAVALGLGIPLGYELFNRRVRCRDDLERHHGVPVLVEFGALPMMRSAL